MKKLKLILILLMAILSTEIYAQKGGLLYPAITKKEAVSKGYIIITCADSLIKYAKISNSKIFIAAGFNIAQRCSVSGNNVLIECDKKSTITSTVWLSPFRLTETIFIQGNNVTIRGLKLKGDSPDILTLDHNLYQEGIRIYGDSATIINCEITDFDFAAIYCHKFKAARIEQCYLARCKRSGYGYGVWFEGKAGSNAIVKDCIFEDNRESIDAGGQPTVWTVEGCITDRGFTAHRNPRMQAGIGTTVTGNYMLEDAGAGFPYPMTDTGWLVIKGNFAMRSDSTAFNVRDSVNEKAKINIKDNHYNGDLMQRPECFFAIDNNPQDMAMNDVVKITIKADYPLCQVNWGDGGESVIVPTGILYHTYTDRGSYYIKVRIFDNKGVPSLWNTQRIVLGKNEISFAVKTTARFTPDTGYYSVQMLIDDSVTTTFEAAKIYKWVRYADHFPLTGKHKIALRLICIKDCAQAIQLWIDDFDYNGRIPNSGFEDDDNYYHPPNSNWRQKFNGNISIGSGITKLEKCGGEYSWHFEFRPGPATVKAGSYAELYQTISF